MRTSDLPSWPKEERQESREFYSGREFEYDLFGKMDTSSPRYKAELQKIASPNGYVSYAKALELVKKFQSQDPTNPDKDFLRELRDAVTEKLRLDTAEEMERIKTFSSLGSPLDKFHGVDAFLAYEENDKEYSVSLDATRRKEKQEEGWKADIIISDLPSPEEDEEQYMREIEKYAEEITEKIKARKRQEKQKAVPRFGRREIQNEI